MSNRLVDLNPAFDWSLSGEKSNKIWFEERVATCSQAKNSSCDLPIKTSNNLITFKPNGATSVRMEMCVNQLLFRLRSKRFMEDSGKIFREVPNLNVFPTTNRLRKIIYRMFFTLFTA